MSDHLEERVHHLIMQINSNENFVRDTYLRQNMDEQGWISVSLIAGFKINIFNLRVLKQMSYNENEASPDSTDWNRATSERRSDIWLDVKRCMAIENAPECVVELTPPIEVRGVMILASWPSQPAIEEQTIVIHVIPTKARK
nr:RNA-binding protein Lupus La [Tanacetum cinerariifolium]